MLISTFEAPLVPARALKEATADAHQHLESLVDAPSLLAGELGLEGYTRLIARNYQWHWLLETELIPWVEGIKELDYASSRRKLPALDADLACLGRDPKPLRQNLPAPVKPENLPQALGLLYVIEGATLGGSVIRRALDAQPAIAASGALHYYGLYGDALGPRWRACQLLLNQRLGDAADLAQASRFARIAFALASEVFAADPFRAPAGLRH